MRYIDDPFIEAVSCARAAGLARNYRGSADPFEDVKPSLLSASDIKRYAKLTGMISPFFTGGGKNSRLKKASYEGRIGQSAYVFTGSNGDFVNILQPNKPLLIRANSIVFVECDLEFRLPRNIAVRFNLQIVHVHRGLLLGTGPLVDPGFFGKLCIPLHNLTNQDYEIPLEEGLIWVEFTKTTADNDQGRNPLADSSDNEHWDVRKFLVKASRQFDPSKPSIGIHSSIPDSAADAKTAAKLSADKAQSALAEATSAKAAASASRNWNIGGALVTIVTVVALWATFFFGARADIAALTARIDALQNSIANTASK